MSPKRALNEEDIRTLQAIADGNDGHVLADLLHMKYNSSKNRVKRILDYLGADNRAHGVAIAMRKGIIK